MFRYTGREVSKATVQQIESKLGERAGYGGANVPTRRCLLQDLSSWGYLLYFLCETGRSES